MARVHCRYALLSGLLQVVNLRENMSHVGIKLAQEIVALMKESELCTHVGEELGREGGREGGWE